MSTHIADPNMRVDLSVTTMRQAMATELFNARQQLQAAINDLNRVKANSGRGNKQASYDGYNRAWKRVEQHAKRIFEMTGEESEVPKYDPPESVISQGKTQRIGAPDPFAQPAAPTPKRSKPIPKHIKPGTAAWYRVQGVPVPEGVPE